MQLTFDGGLRAPVIEGHMICPMCKKGEGKYWYRLNKVYYRLCEACALFFEQRSEED